ncbi:MAG TPA: hypothetical protein VLA16_03425 [Ideonella sp.]|nr:hypothetical protein [Ideonella sp.]
MSFTETPLSLRSLGRSWSAWRSLGWLTVVGVAAGWLAACNSRVPLSPAPPPPKPSTSVPAPWPEPGQPPEQLSGPARNWQEYRTRAALRMVAANPKTTYTGEVPEPLLAIPVIEIELHADGSIAKLHVMRHPSQAKDTTQLAMDAIRRSAPFGDVSRLPKPWKFAEVFLFDEDRKFKPRTLDQ